MYMTQNTENINDDELFEGDEFVFTQRTTEDGQKEIIGGGYKVKSFFLQNDIPALTTFNSGEQNGGKVSSPFENLAVPAGLFYINQKIPKHQLNKRNHYTTHEMMSDDMMDKLFKLVEHDNKKKRKTRKQNDKQTKKIKTRRYK